MVIRLDGDLAGEFAARLRDRRRRRSARPRPSSFIRGLLAKIPLKLNVNITGPFRALIATAKSFSDPRTLIGDVLPAPLDDDSRHHHRGAPGRGADRPRPRPRPQQVEVTTATTPPQRKMMPMTQHDPHAPALLALRRWPRRSAAAFRSRRPDKPIEINLNVTIRQEVLVRLQRDVEHADRPESRSLPAAAATQ